LVLAILPLALLVHSLSAELEFWLEIAVAMQLVDALLHAMERLLIPVLPFLVAITILALPRLNQNVDLVQEVMLAVVVFTLNAVVMDHLVLPSLTLSVVLELP